MDGCFETFYSLIRVCQRSWHCPQTNFRGFPRQSTLNLRVYAVFVSGDLKTGYCSSCIFFKPSNQKSNGRTNQERLPEDAFPDLL